MTHENGATVSNLWRGRPSDSGTREVHVDVPRTRDAEFTAFVWDSGPYLHRTAYLLCGDPHRAEELVQSTFERVYRTWAKVKPDTQRAYARRILVNLRIDSWRHGHRESFPGDEKIPVATTSDHAGQVVLRDELIRGLAQLSTTQRRVVVLRHLLDLPEAEVARELGLAVGTVKAANSRGLARLRDLLRAGTEAIEPVAFDEQAVLDRSRAALRRRRVAQVVGAACLVLLIALGVVTRGPVPLPGVGPVVLPGGQLVAPLFDAGRVESVRPDPTPAGNTPVACPEQVPDPTPALLRQPGEDLDLLDDALVVDAADARPLTCYDVDLEEVTRGSFDETGLPVTEDGGPMPEPGGLSSTGEVWLADNAQLYDNSDSTQDAFIRTSLSEDGEPTVSVPVSEYQGVTMFPVGLAVAGDRVAWGEYAAAETSPRITLLRTVEVGGEPQTIAELDDDLRDVVLSQEHAVWTAGPFDDRHLFAKPVSGTGSVLEFDGRITALGGDASTAVAAVVEPGPGGSTSTSVRLFDNLAGGDTDGVTVAQVDDEDWASLQITNVAVTADVVAWVAIGPNADDLATLYVFDRRGNADSIVHLTDRVVEDLRASGGLITWNSTDTAGDPAVSSYLYRATPSASGYDGPDLARFPGESVTAGLAGNRTAWLENQGQRQWLVEGTVAPTLERD
ncbi:RNA polymerase sigma-70 factor (sigma-E family) [Promicromonospora sp. AC04]|uniref:SigE family RNA polymerase sigma factor n=1 Tax=Promicromonospora sp. AC04 TaxID=2135723 RepID=UPI000D46871E|nr:SigE family RNA polymerase sigma factor [Promicromonospora sp. AC04]PUB28847.1 RNA polymerase sigma-70 factor (sigma-E family) [Promicromonospora sp. AC04]